MPPMEREEYEGILNKLNNPELEHSERAELLQTLRADYSQVHHDFSETNQKLEHYQKDNDDLVKANSKLFRNLGYEDQGNGTKDPVQQKNEEQEFNETITISDIESNLKKSANQY